MGVANEPPTAAPPLTDVLDDSTRQHPLQIHRTTGMPRWNESARPAAAWLSGPVLCLSRALATMHRSSAAAARLTGAGFWAETCIWRGA